MFPNRKQWKKWTLPSKLSVIGAYIGIFGLLLTIILFFAPSFTGVSERETDRNGTLIGERPEPNKKILEKYPKVTVTTTSTWNGGSHTENCVPSLTQKAGYVLVGGDLGPPIRFGERQRAGCAPPGHCDGAGEYCTTVDRSPACYINQEWYDWKVRDLAKTTGNINYQTICEP